MAQAAKRDAPSGPFAQVATDLAIRGLSPIPCGGEDGKTPRINWAKIRRVTPKGAAELALKFGAANVGILTGARSGVTIVDVDDAALLPVMLERCGDSPVITRTPSGGYHLCYRSSGERNVQRLDGLPVDVRGEGGFAVVPPSVRPDGALYDFERGSWGDLSRLPYVRPGSLPMVSEPEDARTAVEEPSLSKLRAVRQGHRNDALFRLLLRKTKDCGGFEALLDCAIVANESFAPPLPDAEVIKTAGSAWRYEVEGRNWVGRDARIIVTKDDLMELADKPEALVLWQVLLLTHSARPEPFAVSPDAMAKAETIKGWRWPDHYRRARKTLLARGKLELVHKGGKGKGDPGLYRLVGVRVRKPHPM